MVLVYCKNLTNTEINYKTLFYPTRYLNILPFEEGKCDAKFYVSYRYERPRLFRCIKRGREDDYAKLTMNIGWADIVRDKGLSVGDKLIFHLEEMNPYIIGLKFIERSMVFGISFLKSLSVDTYLAHGDGGNQCPLYVVSQKCMLYCI